MNAQILPRSAHWLFAEVAADPYHAMTAYERPDAAPSLAIFENLARAYDASLRWVGQCAVKPAVNLYLRSRMVDELSHLSDRSLSDIGMSRRDILAAARAAFPLFGDSDEGKAGLPSAHVQPVAAIVKAQQAAPANDDSNRRAA